MAHEFIPRSLKSIAEGADRRHPKVHEKAQEVLEKLSKVVKDGRTLTPYVDQLPLLSDDTRRHGVDLIVQKWDYFANLIVLVLEMAVETQMHAIAEPSLDCIQKMMAFGYIRTETGDSARREGSDGLLLHRVASIVVACWKFAEGRAGESLQVRILSAITTAITTPACGLHGAVLMEAIRTAFNIHLLSTSKINRDMAKGALAHVVSALFSHLEAQDGREEHAESVRDCQLVFKTLCELSRKDLPSNVNVHTHDLREGLDLNTKILALELMHTVLEGSAHLFHQHAFFVDKTVKKYLCLSLSTNAASPILPVFRLSTLIFLAMLRHFRADIKSELGVFFGVFLRILESANSSSAQKALVVGLMRAAFAEPQVVVDLFLNYDCDLHAVDIFGRAVSDLAKMAQADVHDADALAALVAAARSMRDWCAPMYVPPRLQEAAQEDDEDDIDLSAAPALTPAPLADKFEQQKRTKIMLDHGRSQFKLKPRAGIQYFQETGMCGTSDADVARFLRETPGLDKTKIGEYLGEPKNIQVLYAYVDNHFNFGGLHIDIALREFLQHFRLPGEAQKIDRMMEKFAERYFTDNSGSATVSAFGNADSVYLLAFAIIMLATDLHSDQIVNKITFPAWKTNLRGLNDGQDYDPAYLEAVFARIQAEELKLSDDAITAMGTDARSSDMVSEKQRQSAFKQETEALVQKAKALLSMSQSTASVYVCAKEPMYARPMFEVVWAPMLAAFSTAFEASDERELILLCLDGFKACVRVAGIFELETALDTLVSALVRFGGLDDVHVIGEKQCLAIDTLIELAHTDGNHLGPAWKQVLSTMAILRRLHLLGSGNSDEELEGTREHVERVQHNAALVARRVRADDLDRVFSHSKMLSSHAILMLVRGMCTVSREELSMSPPRTYTLQKMVEVAVENMRHRIRIVWTRMWELLAEHFEFAGCHANKKVAVFAIDSLRQLSMKFLEMDELANYNFQKAFLKPFEVVSKTKSRFVREYVIECLCMMIAARAPNIKSGWKSILSVFAAQAQLPKSEKMVTRSFEMLQDILSGYFPLAAEQFFPDLVNALAAYAAAKRMGELSPFAIRSIRACADKLAAGDVIPLPPDNPHPFAGKVGYELWFPVVHALVRTITAANMDNRRLATKALMKILRLYGHFFDVSLWELLYRGALVKIFDPLDDIKPNPPPELQDWLMTTCFKALHGVVQLFSRFFDSISFLLEDILALLARCINNANETLATFGATTLETLIQDNKHKFTAKHWTLVTRHLASTLATNTPNAIFTLKVSRTALRRHSDPKQPSTPAAPQPAPPQPAPQPVGFFAQLFGSRGPAQEPTPAPKAPPVKESKPEAKEEEEGSEFLPPEQVALLIGQARIQAMLMRIILTHVIRECWAKLETGHVDTLMAALADQYSFGTRVNASQQLHHVLEVTGNQTLLDLLQPIEFESMVAYLNCLFQMHAETERDVRNRRRVAEEHLMRTCYGIIKEYLTGAEQLLQTPRRTSSNYAMLHKKEKPLTAEQRSIKMNTDAKIPIIVVILEEFAKFRDDQFAETLPVFYDLFCDLIVSDSIIIRQALRTTMARIGRLRVNIGPLPSSIENASSELSIMPPIHEIDLYPPSPSPKHPHSAHEEPLSEKDEDVMLSEAEVYEEDKEEKKEGEQEEELEDDDDHDDPHKAAVDVLHTASPDVKVSADIEHMEEVSFSDDKVAEPVQEATCVDDTPTHEEVAAHELPTEEELKNEDVDEIVGYVEGERTEEHGTELEAEEESIEEVEKVNLSTVEMHHESSESAQEEHAVAEYEPAEAKEDEEVLDGSKGDERDPNALLDDFFNEINSEIDGQLTKSEDMTAQGDEDDGEASHGAPSHEATDATGTERDSDDGVRAVPPTAVEDEDEPDNDREGGEEMPEDAQPNAVETVQGQAETQGVPEGRDVREETPPNTEDVLVEEHAPQEEGQGAPLNEGAAQQGEQEKPLEERDGTEGEDRLKERTYGEIEGDQAVAMEATGDEAPTRDDALVEGAPAEDDSEAPSEPSEREQSEGPEEGTSKGLHEENESHAALVESIEGENADIL